MGWANLEGGFPSIQGGEGYNTEIRVSEEFTPEGVHCRNYEKIR